MTLVHPRRQLAGVPHVDPDIRYQRELSPHWGASRMRGNGGIGLGLKARTRFSEKFWTGSRIFIGQVKERLINHAEI